MGLSIDPDRRFQERHVGPDDDEIRAMLAAEPLTVTGPYGLAYDPLADRWSESADVDINYMMIATRD